MEVIEDVVPQIINLLIARAVRRSAIRYSEIYRLFDKKTPKDIVWNTFREACSRIAPSKEAIYGVLMAKRSTDLPGDGFYDIFKNAQYPKYLEIIG